MKLKSIAALAAAAVLSLATAASAAVISVNTTPDLSLYGLNGTIANVSIVSGNLGGAYASPFGAGSDSYYTVGSGPGFTLSPAVLTVAAVDTLNLLWGSVDTYNMIQFFLGNAFVEFVSGADIVANGGSFGATAGVSIKTTGLFDTVKFSSNFGIGGDQPAFEFVTEAPAAVPVPAAGLLLLGALGGLAALRRRNAA